MVALTRRGLLGAGLALPVALGGEALGSGARATLDLAAFGGWPAVADNTAALRAALAALAGLGGGVVRFGAGLYRFAAAAVGRGGIVLPAGITLRGAGRSDTVLKVSGQSVCNLFVAVDRSGIALEDLALVGNGAGVVGASVYGSGAAIRWLLSPGARAGVSGFAIRRVHLENFGGPYWIDVENDGTFAMQDLVIEDLTFTARAGNSPAPADIRINASAVCINGWSAPIRTVRVSRLSGDARHIKSGIILYHAVEDAVLDDLTITDAGVAGATDDAGGYAIQIYDSAYRMTAVTVSNAVIRGPRSAGIYIAGVSGITIEDARINGQTDQEAGTLPKGAIVFNGTRNWQVAGGALGGNWRDLDIAMPAHGSPAAPDRVGGQVIGVRAEGSATGIVIRHAAGHVATGIAIRDCRWRTETRTVLVQNSADGYVDGVVFEDCRFEAGDGWRAMDLWGTSGSPAGRYVVAHCTLIGTNPLFARDQAGSLRIEGCTVSDRGTLSGTAAATLVGCAAIELSNTTFRSPGRDGIGIDLGNSRGIVRDLRFADCTRILPLARLPVQLGRDKPGFAGRAAQYVQNLEPGAGEDAGWTCTGGRTWQGGDIVRAVP